MLLNVDEVFWLHTLLNPARLCVLNNIPGREDRVNRDSVPLRISARRLASRELVIDRSIV